MTDSPSIPNIPTLDLSPQELQGLLPKFGHAGLSVSHRAHKRPLPGKILRLRLGMNPNSSSVGTNVIVFMWTLTSCAAIFTIASGLLAARFAESDADQEAGSPEETSENHG